MNKFITSLVFLLGFTAFSQETNIEISEEFSELKIYNKIQAELIPASENKIVATGFDKDEIEAKVKNGVLKVKMGLNNIWSENDTKIKIYFKNVEVIDANEGTFAELKEPLQQTALTLKVQEGAEIYAPRLDLENLNIKCVTGGKIETKGKATNQIVAVKTGGEYEGEDLLTNTTDVNIKAGGEAEVNATTYCKAKVSAGGTIYIYGKPEQVEQKTTLGGSIKMK